MTMPRRAIPDLAKLQAFECAARHASFTDAAKELDLTQSAVSRQIKELEAQLGILLFERVRQRVVLSGAGRRFLAETRRILAQTEEAMMRMMTAPQGSELRLATLPTFGARWLIPRLPSFLAQMPGLSLNLTSHARPFDLEEGAYDVAIHYGEPVWPQASCRYICQEQIVPVAAPSILAGRQRDARMLLRGLFLHLETRPAAWSDWFSLTSVEAPSSLAGHCFDQFSMVIQAAVGGLGFALLPRYLIEREIRDGELEVVLDLPLVTENAYYLVIPNRELENPLVERFYDWIRGQVSHLDGTGNRFGRSLPPKPA
jgi:LysR family glycine cleavage system transcriptional activator